MADELIITTDNTETQDAPGKQGSPATILTTESIVDAIKEAMITPDPIKTADAKIPDIKPDVEAELEKTITKMAAAVNKARDSVVRAAAIEVGIKTERIPYAMKLVDLKDIDVMADDATAKIAEQMKILVTEMPEFMGTGAGVGTGSMGNHARQQLTTEEQTRAEFERGMNM